MTRSRKKHSLGLRSDRGMACLGATTDRLAVGGETIRYSDNREVNP